MAMDDASLDDFLGTDGASDDADGVDTVPEQGGDAGEPAVAGGDGDESDDGSETEKAHTDEAQSADDAVEPATSTMTFSPAGADCEECGATVRRRWTDGGVLRCRSCKEW